MPPHWLAAPSLEGFARVFRGAGRGRRQVGRTLVEARWINRLVWRGLCGGGEKGHKLNELKPGERHADAELPQRVQSPLVRGAAREEDQLRD